MLEFCQRAMQQAKSPTEQKLVLSGLSNVGDPGALEIVEPFMHVEAVSTEAGMAAIKIAEMIMETYGEKAKTSMMKLLTVSNDDNLRKRAEEIIRQIK